MALVARKLVALGVASYTVANDAELSIYAGVTAACLVLTTWNTSPVKVGDVKKALQDMATDNGIPLTDWQDKVGAVFKVADKIQRLMPADPLLLAVRDANDELAALQAMRDLFSVKGLSCRHYFKQWANLPGIEAFDPEAAKAARAERDRAKRASLLDTVSNIDAASEALAAKTVLADAAETLTPLQRFMAAVEGISDMQEIDAMFAVLNGRAEALRAIAAAPMPAPVPGETRAPRGERAKARREAETAALDSAAMSALSPRARRRAAEAA